MKRFVFALCFVLAVLSGCKKQPDKTDETIELLNVDLEVTNPSYKDLFSRVELIMLESDPQAMLGSVDKVEAVGDSILILDMYRACVCLFSPDGHFLNNVGARGNGPEEYLSCYDFSLNPSQSAVSLMSPQGELVKYTLTGKFLERQDLPPRHNYFACEGLDNGTMAFWSIVNSDENGVSVVNPNTNEIVYEDWNNDRIVDMSRMKPFYSFKGKVKFSAPLSNDVYNVGDSCMTLEYKWVFRPDNISKSYVEEIASIEDTSVKNNKLISDTKSGTLKGIPSFNGETAEFYYVALQTGIGEDAEIKSVFYIKTTDRSIVFVKFKEGVSFHPVFMNDEYVLCQIPYDEISIYNELLHLDIKYTEDDNPVLAKFYF